MAKLSGALSAFDERARAADSASGIASDFRVQPGELSYGELSAKDSADWFNLRLPTPGTYKLTVSIDPVNNHGPANVWSVPDFSALLVTLAYPGDQPFHGWGSTYVSSVFGATEGSVVFVYDGPPLLNTLYVKVEDLFGGEAVDYVLSLEVASLLGAGQQLTGTDGFDALTGDSGNDTLRGKAGDDFLVGGLGDDMLDGGDGVDAALFGLGSTGVTVNLAFGTASGGDGNDTLVSIEAVYGTPHADTLTGSAGADELDGDRGNDTLFGGEGDDDLTGGPGDDQIDGGTGDDTAYFPTTTLVAATLSFDEGTGVLTVTTPGEGTDRLRNVEWLDFADQLISTAKYTDRTPPTISAFNPAQGTKDAPVGGDILIVFSEPVELGSGTITLRTEAGTVVATYNVRNSPNLSLGSDTLKIDPTDNLIGLTGYRIDLDPGIVKDRVGNAFAGHSGYTFTTEPPPLEVSIADASASEGARELRFVITLSRPSSALFTVRAGIDATSTANAGEDFEPTEATISIPAGETKAEFVVPLLQDNRFESTEVAYARLTSPSSGIVGRAVGAGHIQDDDSTPGIVLPADPLVGLQWHLYPGIGANVLPLWPEYTGKGVAVGVFDQGIDSRHGDLGANVDTARGRSAADPQVPGAGDPLLEEDNHGTAVSGVIGALRDGKGTVGVAYGATLVSYYSPLDKTTTPQSIANAYGYAREVDILNDSWGYAPQYWSTAPWAFYDNFRKPAFAAAGDALKLLADTGRGGLGTVVVQSAGNSYAFGDDTNLHNFQNSRYIVTVGATDFRGDSTSYSSPGASVLISAPGGGGGDPLSNILTTDRSGLAGYDGGDTTMLSGTSFAAPVVSGVVALMLEANPALGWRDVQLILACSARETAGTQNTWQFNGARHWNGGGLHFDAISHDLGFGLVDARAAVRLAESWGSRARTSANLAEASATSNVVAAIPDGKGALVQTVSIANDLEIERVEVTVDLPHDYIGDLRLKLTSPAGTESWLLSNPGGGGFSPFGNDVTYIDFTFTTVLSMGESARGLWTLTVTDTYASDIGSLNAWTLRTIGRPASVDDTFVYTDEFAESVIRQAARATLSDAAGEDTLNAAAVSTASRIDLTPGAASRIDGQALTIALGTVIEHVWGGDGADELLGNQLANRLHGMRGNDLLQGRGGDDTLDGGPGLDVARYAGDRAGYTVVKSGGGWRVADQRGDEGSDTLAGIERLDFTDLDLALDTGAGGNAMRTAQLIYTLLGPGSLAEPAIAGIGLALIDAGTPYESLMRTVITSDFFAALAGSHSNRDFVRQLWRNVVGSTPGDGDIAPFVGLLDSGTMTQLSMAQQLGDSAFVTASAALVGIAANGLEFLPGG